MFSGIRHVSLLKIYMFLNGFHAFTTTYRVPAERRGNNVENGILHVDENRIRFILNDLSKILSRDRQFAGCQYDEDFWVKKIEG